MLSNFPNGVSSFGIPVLPTGTGVFTGTAFFVKPYSGNDGNSGLSPDQAFKTLATAKAAATANKNDVVYLIAESNTGSLTTDYQEAVLDWSKDGVHLIGINAGTLLGQRSRIANKSTVASFATLFTLSANNCLIANIEVYQGAGTDTLSAAQTAFKVTGSRNRIVNCQISGMGDTTMDYAGSNSLTLTGSENLFQHCYIGLDTVIRATSVTEVVISGGARNTFEDCVFRTYTSGSTFKMVSVATTCDRFIRFKRCEFLGAQNLTGSVSPTGAFGITTMNGTVILSDPLLYGFTQYVTADNAYVQVLGHNGLATGHLVGITQGVDAT
jgi:hypothetical protein